MVFHSGDPFFCWICTGQVRIYCNIFRGGYQGTIFGNGGGGGGGVCADMVRCLLDRVYVHFFVSRQRNGTKENALRGSAPKYPAGLCAFCPWGTKLHSTVASLLPQSLHNPAMFFGHACVMTALSRQEKLDGFA